jgi:hypothetical protein
MKKTKKGISLGQLPQLFMVIMMIGVFVGASYITLASFQNTTGNESRAYTGIGYVLDFLDSIVSNLPMVGVIVFVTILLGVITSIYVTKRSSGGA